MIWQHLESISQNSDAADEKRRDRRAAKTREWRRRHPDKFTLRSLHGRCLRRLNAALDSIFEPRRHRNPAYETRTRDSAFGHFEPFLHFAESATYRFHAVEKLDSRPRLYHPSCFSSNSCDAVPIAKCSSPVGSDEGEYHSPDDEAY